MDVLTACRPTLIIEKLRFKNHNPPYKYFVEKRKGRKRTDHEKPYLSLQLQIYT